MRRRERRKRGSDTDETRTGGGDDTCLPRLQERGRRHVDAMGRRFRVRARCVRCAARVRSACRVPGTRDARRELGRVRIRLVRVTYPLVLTSQCLLRVRIRTLGLSAIQRLSPRLMEAPHKLHKDEGPHMQHLVLSAFPRGLSPQRLAREQSPREPRGPHGPAGAVSRDREAGAKCLVTRSLGTPASLKGPRGSDPPAGASPPLRAMDIVRAVT